MSEQKYNALQEIRTQIGGCFGDQDLIFAGHPFDKERAEKIRKIARTNGITPLEMEEIVLGFLYRKGCRYMEHFSKEVDKAATFFSK